MAVVCQYRTIKSWHQGLFLSQFIQRRSSELVVMAGPEEKCWLISYAGELLWHCQTIIWCEVIIGQTPGDPMEIYSNSTALIESQWQGRHWISMSSVPDCGLGVHSWKGRCLHAVSAMWGLVVFFTQKACQNNVLNKIVSFFFFNELKVTIEAPYMYFSLIFIGEILWLLVLRLLSPIWHNIFD